MTEAGKLSVAVTREAGRNAELSALLRERGAVPVELPLICFVPALTAHEFGVALSGPPGWLVLTSPQGARALGEILPAGLPAGWRVAAVGEGTARVLRAGGLSVAFVAARAEASALGATLPAPPGARTIHLTSQRSHGTLGAVLEARGLSYERLSLYRTEAAPLSPAQREALGAVDVVALASGSAAQALADAVGVGLPVAVLGAQTSAVARALGFTRVALACAPTLPALADAALRAARPPPVPDD